ncbi:radical SAM protein [Streptomyces sp. NPDC001941]|uniref:radical SAM protein n=1 Tax=Streptomyces sp. NPDC001941 TaxID=3154659 RepID=UPI00332B942A
MTQPPPLRPNHSGLDSLGLQLTPQCEVSCAHCLSDSGPEGLRLPDWKRVISEAAALGIPLIELGGGDPLAHRDCPVLVEHALGHGLRIAVRTALLDVSPLWWDLLAHDGVTLVTRYYSDLAREHDRITGLPRSHARTRAHLVRAHRRHLPVRVHVEEVFEGQRVRQAVADVVSIGITDVTVGAVRAVHGADGDAVVLRTGDLAVSRYLPCGNVLTSGLGSLLAVDAWERDTKARR